MAVSKLMGGAAALVLAGLMAGCGMAPHGAVQVPVGAAAAAGHFRRPLPPRQGMNTPEQAFVAACAAKGVNLTPDQLAEIKAERDVVPNDTWAPRPADNLTADQNLQVHFLKHGSQFNPPPANEAAYMAQGNAAATGKRGPVRYFFDTESYAKAYQSHVMRWVEATHDFTAFRPDGSETTYYIDTIDPARYVEVPAW